MSSAALKLESFQTKVALQAVWERHCEIMKPPPRLTVSQWADEYRELSREANAKGGKWRSLPFQREPMDAVNDPTVHSTALMWASQLTGKTEILNNIVGYFIQQDPSPILFVTFSLDMAESWSKERFAPMLRDTGVLRGVVADARRRDSGNTILHKSFPGGHITIAGANSPAGLAFRPVRVLLFDEIDRYEASAGTEGDPISIAERRAESFWNAVKFKVSSPGIKGASRIEKEIEVSDKRKWFVPCPKCGEWQVLAWHQVKWPDGKPEEATLECAKCNAMLNDADRLNMVKSGNWQPTSRFTGIRGYILNGLNCLFPPQKGFKNRLHQFVVDFLRAKAIGKEGLKVWTNTFLAEVWEDDAQAGPPAELIYARREDY